MLQLRFSVDGEDKLVPLSGSEIRFGRSGDNEVVLPDYSVSRRHAALRHEAEGWVLYDLKSTNGVQVNGANIQRALVQPHDRLKIGVFELLVESKVSVIDELAETELDTAIPPDIKQQVQAALGPTPRYVPASGAPAAGAPAAGGPMAGAPMAGAPASGAHMAGAPGLETVKPPPLSGESAISNATIIRSISDLSVDYGLESGEGHSSAVRKSKREALDEAYSSKIFGFLTRLARLLITTEADDKILEHVLEITFEALPVDRGFILLRDEASGELECEVVRINDQVELRPESEVPISKTMLESVIKERVALLTYDALSDQRLAGTESVRIHQIRAAMCAPLWSGEKIIGVMQVDTPHHAGSFKEPDVDLLAALSNYCAVAIERNRNAREAEFQRQVRGRLERYHSPAVIEEVMQEGTAAAGDEAVHGLKQAEVSVLFADIVGFTAYSEKARPREVAELMEGYFTLAVDAIFSQGGTLDKFIGDCVMAFFGAPMSQPDHAYRAVQAAVTFSAGLDSWNAERERQGQRRIASRIGINTGPVVVGDIGSKKRVDYTVLGNTVNVAARLEEKVAQPGDIVLGDTTCQELAGRIATESLGEVTLKGLSRPIVAHRVVREVSST
ncbi:MAG: adenylate/guanylate cyclase domain-containing protein [Acidobacteriota bacterium]